MAETLGITPYQPGVDINFGRTFADNLQSLGNQLREDMLAVQANRQVKNLGASLSQLDPRSDVFPTQLAQVAMANPLGVVHPAGKLAISTIGAAYKEWKRSVEEQKPAYSSGARGLIYDKRTGEVVREPDQSTTGSTASPFRSMVGGGIYNAQTGEVVREPSSRASTQDPALKDYEADKNRLQSAIIKAETDLQQSAGGLDLEKLRTAKKTYRVNAKDKQADDGEFVVMELPDGTKSKLDWKTFSKIHGNLTAVEKLRGELSTLKPPAKVNAPIPTSTPTLEGDLPTGEGIAGSLGLMPTEQPTDSQHVRIQVIAPDGTPGTISASQRDAALKAGYKLR